MVTIGVALAAFGSLSDRSDEVRHAGERQALALELKFAVTDMNGWQTAYGYDDGRSRPTFEASVERTQGAAAGSRAASLREPRERELLDELETAFDAFMELDVDAYEALQAGREAAIRRIFLGPEIRNFEAMARAADELAREQDRRAVAAAREFDDARTTARRELVAVAIGAGVVIVLLLLTGAGRRPARAGAPRRVTRDVILTVGLLLAAGLAARGAGRRAARARDRAADRRSARCSGRRRSTSSTCADSPGRAALFMFGVSSILFHGGLNLSLTVLRGVSDEPRRCSRSGA